MPLFSFLLNHVVNFTISVDLEHILKTATRIDYFVLTKCRLQYLIVRLSLSYYDT